MLPQVCAGAALTCTFGLGPSTLMVTPENRLTTGGLPAATIMDFIPLKNIMPFPLCASPTNPAVIAATIAKLGVFTPVPCIPLTLQPWAPGSPAILIAGQPALNSTSVLLCQWAGVISASVPGQVAVTVP